MDTWEACVDLYACELGASELLSLCSSPLVESGNTWMLYWAWMFYKKYASWNIPFDKIEMMDKFPVNPIFCYHCSERKISFRNCCSNCRTSTAGEYPAGCLSPSEEDQVCNIAVLTQEEQSAWDKQLFSLTACRSQWTQTKLQNYIFYGQIH